MRYPKVLFETEPMSPDDFPLLSDDSSAPHAARGCYLSIRRPYEELYESIPFEEGPILATEEDLRQEANDIIPFFGAVTFDTGKPMVWNKHPEGQLGRFFFTNLSREHRVFTIRFPDRREPDQQGSIKMIMPPHTRVQFSAREFAIHESTHMRTIFLHLSPKVSRGCEYTPPDKWQNLWDSQETDVGVMDRLGFVGMCDSGRIPTIQHPKEGRKTRAVAFNGLAFFFFMNLVLVGLACSLPEVSLCETCYLPEGAVCTSNSQCLSGSCFITCQGGIRTCPVGNFCTPQGNCSKSSNICCSSSSNCPGSEVCRSSPTGGVCKRACGEMCLVDEDCAFGECPPGGGVCTGCLFNTNPRTPEPHCCIAGRAVPISQCTSVSATSTMFVSASPTTSLSPSGTLMASLMATPTPTPTGTFFASATGTTTTTTGMSEQLMKQFHQAHLPASSAAVVRPLFLTSILAFAEAAKCLGSRVLPNSAYVQEEGDEPLSCGEDCEILINQRKLWGIGDPTIEQVGECPSMKRPTSRPRHERQLILSDNIFSVDLTGNLFTYSFQEAASRVVVLNLRGESFPTVCSDIVCFVAVDPEMLWQSSTAVISVYVGDEEVNTATVEIIGEKPCFIKDCWTCNMTNWSCIPKALKAVLVVSIILLSIMAIWLLIKMGLMTLGCLGIIIFGGVGFFWDASRWSWTKSKESYKRLREVMTPPVVVPIVAALAIPVASACDSSFVQSVPLSSCTVINGIEDCSLSIETEMSLLGPGYSSCVVFSRPTGPIGQISIKFESNMLSCPLTDSYYTSSFTVYSASSFHCSPSLNSNCSSDCSSLNLRESAVFGAEDYLDFPGKTNCQRLCGTGLSCGCVLPTPGCLYSTWSILPQDDVTKVSAYAGCVNKPKFSYEIRSDAEVLRAGSFSFSGVLEFDDAVEMQILTSIERSVPNGMPTHLCEGSKKYFCDASSLNHPRAGMIGDIQSSNETGLAAGQFIYAPEIILGENVQKKSSKVISRAPGLNQEGKALPCAEAGLIWSSDEVDSDASEIFAFDTRPSPVQVGLRVIGNFSVSRVVNPVCPEARNFRVEGCHSCQAGFVLSFQARSSCMGGGALAYSDHVAEQILDLEKEWKDFKLVGRSNETELDEDLTIKDKKFNYKGELEEGIMLGQEAILYSGKDEPAHVSFRKGNWKWWEYLVSSIIIFLGFLFILLVAYLILWPIIWGMFQRFIWWTKRRFPRGKVEKGTIEEILRSATEERERREEEMARANAVKRTKMRLNDALVRVYDRI